MITIYAAHDAPSLMGRRTKTGDYEISVTKNKYGGVITLTREQAKSLIADMVDSL